MNRAERLITFFSLTLIILGGIGYLYLPSLLSSLRPPEGNFIGIVLETNGEARMRFGDSINWMKVRAKDQIYSKTYLFTGEESSGVYAFLDKSSISLGPNSLIFLDFLPEAKSAKEKAPLAIDLIDGKMEIDLKENSHVKKIKIEDAIIDISKKKTTVKFSNTENEGMEISVMQGDINITKQDKKYNVKSGEKLAVAQGGSGLEKGVVSAEVMAEMKRMKAKNDKLIGDDGYHRRGLTDVLTEIFHIFIPD